MRHRLIVLLCLTAGSTTFAIGAFPALLPDLDRVGLSTMELGSLIAAFGFARMVVDIPVGLVVGRHLRRALIAAPLLLALGILTLGSGGPFWVLVSGRLLMGVAHALGMVTWLSTLLRHQGPSVGAALNAFELTAMLGMLGGVSVIGLLPKTIAWNVALLIACSPVVIAIAIAPFLAAALPSESRARAAPRQCRQCQGVCERPRGRGVLGGRVRPPTTIDGDPSRLPMTSILAFLAGTSVAVTYSTIESFMIPIRGSREFGLDRTGVARLLVLSQVADIIALMPVGMLADRIGAHRVLTGVLVAGGSAALLVSFGGADAMALGAVTMGLGMAGWMLPLALLRQATPPAQIAWRTALYRVGVDGGLFLGPFVAGLLGARAWTLPAILAVVLFTLAVVLATRPGHPPVEIAPADTGRR